VTAVWLPRFECPECLEGVADDGAGGVTCGSCGAGFGPRGGVYRFLSNARAAAASRFEQQYRIVRQREGFRSASPEYYRALPSVPSDDRDAGRWRVRSESFAHLLAYAQSVSVAGPLRVLDLGAGSAWLSHRFACAGHRTVAVDRLDDEADGLGACRHYRVPIVAVQADFDALPFEPAQFDLVVFDGSLHYSPDPASTLAHAARMLAAGGAVAVMDSPMFADEDDGRAMVASERRKLAEHHGIEDAVGPGVGFLTYGALDRAASLLGLHGLFVASNGTVGWRLRRKVSRLRLGRAPAAFGVWVAQ
jgi:SAM-dependent methyltransferase